MIKFEPGTSVDVMIKKLRDYVNKNGIMKDYMRHQYFMNRKQLKELKMKLRQRHQ